MYKSKHDPNKKIPFSALSEKGPNIGLLRADCDPKKYLRARSSQSKNKQVLAPIDANKIPKFSYNDVAKKPKLPAKGEKPIMGLKTEKNFITANAVESILRVPSLPVEKTPDYLVKADYGKVPDYLKDVKEEIKKENEMIDDFVKSQMFEHEDAPEMCVQMPEEEREYLVEKLKDKWDAVNKKYQVLTMYTMFEGHRKDAKEQFEKQLNALESDLMKLSCKGPVMVANE